jgi:hypothetical protein
MNVSHKNSRGIGRINSDVPKSLIRKFPAEIESYKIPNSDERDREQWSGRMCGPGCAAPGNRMVAEE